MHDDTTTEGSGRPPAVGPRLDGGVRPHATVTARLGDIASFRSTSVRKGDAVYTRAELDAAVAAEREQNAQPVPDEWLVKVRRLVQGFEHVSGLARLWEPDYSTGSERALWARATEACADVATLLAETKKA